MLSASASSTSEPHAPASFQGEVQGWRACPYAQPGCPTPVKCHQLHPQGSSTHSLTHAESRPRLTRATRPRVPPSWQWQHAMLYSAVARSPSEISAGLSVNFFWPVPGSVSASSNIAKAAA